MKKHRTLILLFLLLASAVFVIFRLPLITRIFTFHPSDSAHSTYSQEDAHLKKSGSNVTALSVENGYSNSNSPIFESSESLLRRKIRIKERQFQRSFYRSFIQNLGNKDEGKRIIAVSSMLLDFQDLQRLARKAHTRIDKGDLIRRSAAYTVKTVQKAQQDAAANP